MEEKKRTDINQANRESIRRMVHAFERSIRVYTEINLDTMQYRQVNLEDLEQFTPQQESDYSAAFELMCKEQIYEKDVEVVRDAISPEALLKSMKKEKEVSVRYRIKNVAGKLVMQSKIYFVRDAGVHYAILVISDVTRETLSMEKEVLQKQILKNIECGIVTIQFVTGGCQIISVNPMLCKLCGLPEKEIVNMDENAMLMCTVEEDRNSVAGVLKELKEKPCKKDLEFQIRNQATNEILWLHGIGNSVVQEDGSMSVYITYNDITENKKQQLIYESNRKAVRLAQQKGNIASWTYDIDKKEIIQQSSEDEVGNMGYPVHISNVPETFIIMKSIHPDDVEVFLKTYKKIDTGAESADVIYRIMNLETGNYDWIHMYYQRMYQDSSKRMALGFSVVVNEQQKQIEQFRAEKQLRKQIFANAALTVSLDLTEEIIYEMTGRASTYTNVAYWNGKKYSDYYDYVYGLTETDYQAEIEKLTAENLHHMFESGEARTVIFFLGRGTKQSPLLYYRSSAFIVTNPYNGHLNAFIYTEDIDEETKDRLAIENSLDIGTESIALIHVPDGNARLIKTTNRMKFKKTGIRFIYDDNFVQQSNQGVVLEEQDRDYDKGSLKNVISKLEQMEVYEYRITLKETTNGFQKMLFRFKYLNKRKEEIIFSIYDITKLFQEEQENSRKLQAALDDARKANEVTNQFMSRMSHDMRTPMNGILGVAELSKDTDNPEELKKNIATIEESGKYLLNLINDTLDYQKIQSGKLVLNKHIVDIRCLVQNIIQMVKETAEQKGVHFEAKVNSVGTDWYIFADDIRIKQIFVNLLSNAIKFTPPGGKVEWELFPLSREGMISHDLLVVRDTGAGMSQDFLQNDIFKSFSQENNPYSNEYVGSGLGLSIVKNLVELMGGRIEVESKLGEGSAFRVYLDFEHIEKIDPADGQKTAAVRKEYRQKLTGKSILLVEDHPLNAEIARRLLEREGCIVTWASDGKCGVEKFSTGVQNQYDAILMDVRMPVMDGLKATREIRALKRPDAATVPIIAMTANAFDEDVKNCIDAGMNAHIRKPIDTKLLIEVLAEFTLDVKEETSTLKI